MRTISVIFDMGVGTDGHDFMLSALGHAIAARRANVEIDVVRTNTLGTRPLGDGIVLGPGSPYDDPKAAEFAITDARRSGVPLVGT